MRKSKLIKNAAILMSILCMAGAVAGCGERKQQITQLLMHL